MAADSKALPLEVKPLFVPPLQEVADSEYCLLIKYNFRTFFLFSVLNKKLKSNFAEVHVEVVDCPDLRKEPFYLADQGLRINVKLKCI